jgi:hypothetical protein
VTPFTRAAAALLALIAWAGLIVQFHATWNLAGSLSGTVWILLWYFTITTNLLVAIVFTGIAAGCTAFTNASLLGSTTLYILLVGIIYGLLLHGLVELSGGSLIANVLLHQVTPILVPIYWLIFVRKGQLNSRDPLRWAIYPLAYLAYALLRGELTGRYPYPFMNVNLLGWGRTVTNAFLIAIAFLGASWLFVWCDFLLNRRSSRSFDPTLSTK